MKPNETSKIPNEKIFSVGGIPKEEVRTMVKRHHDYSKKHPNYSDKTHVRCVLFKYEVIEYIYNQLTKERAVGADGLRVYFGNYADKDSNGKANPHPNTNTVIFVSTKNGYQDYFTEEVLEMISQNRGEQCQPSCEGVEFISE